MSNKVDLLRHRADAADKIIEDLRAKISAIKDDYVKNASNGLEDRLIRENNDLRAEIASLKRQLCYMEVRNGVQQVPLPTGDTEPAVSVEQPPAASTEAPPPEKKEKKQKKKEGGGDTKSKQAGSEEKPIDVSRLDLRVGHIQAVEKHPDADGLYVETVDVGEDNPRTIVSGLVGHVTLEQMQNLKAIFMCNLKPAKMRGVVSQGMIMCASCPDKVEILHIPQDAQPGTRITFNQYPGEPDDLLPPKKKIWEQVAPDLKVDASGVATYKGAPFLLSGEAVCRAPTLTNVQIK